MGAMAITPQCVLNSRLVAEKSAANRQILGGPADSAAALCGCASVSNGFAGFGWYGVVKVDGWVVVAVALMVPQA